VTKVSKREWPSPDDALRTIERGVFDDSEFDVLLRGDDGRESSAPPLKRRRSRRSPAPPGTDRRDGRAAG
jgi:hypothetical protein